MQKIHALALMIFLVSSIGIGVTLVTLDDVSIENERPIVTDIPVITDEPVVTNDTDTEPVIPFRDNAGIHHLNYSTVSYDLLIDGTISLKFMVNFTSYEIEFIETYDWTPDEVNGSSDMWEVWDFNSSYIMDEILGRNSPSGYSTISNKTIMSVDYYEIVYTEPHDAVFTMLIALDTGLFYQEKVEDTFDNYDFFDVMLMQASNYTTYI